MRRTGFVVREFDPYWRVVQRPEPTKRGEGFLVVDVSVDPARKVFGPSTRVECEAFCRVQVRLWLANKGQVPE